MPAIEIKPVARPIDAVVAVPGSKSDTNRALIAAALADGTSILKGALFSDDTRYMADALRALGFGLETEEAASSIRVTGCNGRIPASSAELFLGNSGTSMRFLTAFVALGRGRFVLDGVERMRARPIRPLIDGLSQLGVRVRAARGNGCPPVIVEADGLRGGRVRMDGAQSSQFFTALLLVGPYTREGIDIEVEGDLVHAPFIDLTAAVMRRFGVTMRHAGYRRLSVAGGQRYRARMYDVEPDASAASYFFAAAALTGGRVRVEGLGKDCAQGDLRFVRVLERMGCRVRQDARSTEVVGPAQLRGIDIDMNEMSDTALTLAAIAPFADAPVTIRGLTHTRLQETDRVAAPVTELRRLGVRVDECPDGMTIHPSTPGAGAVETYEDHRMAMSFALIGLRTPGLRILNPACVRKTFPDYFDRLQKTAYGGTPDDESE